MINRHIRSIITLILVAVLIAPFIFTPVSAAYENTYKNTGNMRNDIIGVALTQVGYREGSNNYTKYGVWYGHPNAAWCGMFVSWCAKEAGIPTKILKRTGVAKPSSFGLSYKSGKEYTPQKGDLFFKKNFSHVGLVYYTEGAYFYTIEGNTSTTSANGDRVQIRKRKISDFYFSSPNYSGSGTTNTGCSHTYKTKAESAHPHKEYKLCTKCDKKSYTGRTKTSETCKTCIQDTCKHTYSDWKKANDTKHSSTCTKCGLKKTKTHNWEKGKILLTATCVDSGKQQMVCADCGAETTKKIEATGEHKYGNFTYIDESSHTKVCKVCDKTVSAKHTAKSNWQNDTIYHWTSCSDCGGRIQHTEHKFQNGCLSPCKVCEYTLEDGHKLSGEWNYDEGSHWSLCDRCGEHANKEAHQYASACDEICDTCGYHRSNTAEHQDIYHSDETGHWRRCNTCTRVTDIESHSADQHANDWDNLLCTLCGYVLRSEDKHIHNYDVVEFDHDKHWGICACGEKIAPEIHSWDFQSGACSICGVTTEEVNNDSSGNFIVVLFQHLFGQ